MWITELEISEDFQAPSVAILQGSDDTAYAQFSDTDNICYYPDWKRLSCADKFRVNASFESTIYGTLYYQIFDSTGITLHALSEKVLLQTFITCELLPAVLVCLLQEADNHAAIIDGYNNTAAQNPYLYYALFDPKFAQSHAFEEAIECGFVTLAEMPALGSNVMNILAYNRDDAVGAIKPPSGTPSQCTTPKYNNYDFYEASMTSTGVSDSTSCDISSSNFQEACISQLILRYTSPVLMKLKSKRDNDWKEMLIDEGAIIGGVMFVLFFFGVFVI